MSELAPNSPHADSSLVTQLPTRETAAPRTAIGRWIFSGGPLSEMETQGHTYPWYLVLWLTGVDYFSSLAYQSGIALLAAGLLTPTATLVLVIVTLIGAVPVYMQVAGRSYAGQGSIAMLETLFTGWKSKIFVLVLLGFASTDFVITMTLSAADAARHAVANPLLHKFVGDAHMMVTIVLLLLLAFIFLVGFREAIRVAALLAVPFLFLNLITIAAGLFRIMRHLELIAHWRLGLTMHSDWTSIMIASALVFPKLALGLSGFETGVAVMPLVSGDLEDAVSPFPQGRVRNTRKLLVAAATVMGVFLILSSFVTTLLIPAEAYGPGGAANGRALAYLAHTLLGNGFGTVYDLSTIAILWFAGASAMAGLINLIPRYLPRFGMAPRWASYRRPMVIVLSIVDLTVTVIFKANVDAQGSAYATGVLVLILSAAVAVAIALWREFRQGWRQHMFSLPLSGYFWLVTALFLYTVIANVFERPDGVIISSIFILTILIFCAISRYERAKELRVSDLSFVDEESVRLWRLMRGKKVNLVPHHKESLVSREQKAAEIREHYQISGPLAFLHVNLVDNRSEFIASLRVRVTRDKDDFVIEVWGASAVANTIAYISELLDPISIFLTLTGQNLMNQALRYVLWGEGEIGLMVYTILLHYWEWIKKSEGRPVLYLMSI